MIEASLTVVFIEGIKAKERNVSQARSFRESDNVDVSATKL